MSDPTKACNLTSDEITALIMCHAREMDDNTLEAALERMNYLHKRLKSFNEVEMIKTEEKPKTDPQFAADAKDAPNTSWGTPIA